MDGTFKDVKLRENRLVESGYSIDFQLKATVTAEIEDECIKYNLEAKNYNDLVDDDVMTPRILILYTLPRDPNEWVKVNEDMTVIKNCAWWCSLKGNKLTSNSHTITIRIPKNQLLTSETLSELMNKIKRGEEI
ncbi:DUF4365 domain-containing protein [Clostridium sp. IBUN22A]|uniref:DUF4365 domain-containing protein n=1 Tax=Clostridium sp. IBUN22A TaxID=1523155 RepID=UPI001FA7E851|nr:DUF4365 domain-containing protein [Clostridium sp. IBUN22A]